jgi:hypothetical protein
MGKLNNYMKIETIKNYLQSVDPIAEKYTQFTVDFIEEWKEMEGETKDNVLALEYLIENILQIVNPILTDYQFFSEINKILES